MCLRSIQQRLLERLNIFSAEPKLGDLKVEHANQVDHARDGRDRNDFEAVRV